MTESPSVTGEAPEAMPPGDPDGEAVAVNLARILRHAIADPGKVLPRGRDHNGLWPLYEWQARAIEQAVLPHLAAVPYRCPTPCDNDCGQACHEVHVIPRRQDHHPETCVATLVAQAMAAERERIAWEADQQAAAADLMVTSPEATITGTALRSFARWLREQP